MPRATGERPSLNAIGEGAVHVRSAIGERLSPNGIDDGAVNVPSAKGEQLLANLAGDGAVNVLSATFLQPIKDEGDRKRRRGLNLLEISASQLRRLNALNSSVGEKTSCP